MKQVEFELYELSDLKKFLDKLEEYISKDNKIKGTLRSEYYKRIALLKHRLSGNNYKRDYFMQRQSYKESCSNETESQYKSRIERNNHKEKIGVIEVKQW